MQILCLILLYVAYFDAGIFWHSKIRNWEERNSSHLLLSNNIITE